MKKFLLMVLPAAILLAGCSKEEAFPDGKGDEVRIAGSILASRAGMEAGFIVGNRVGLYMTAQGLRNSGFSRPEEAWLNNHPFSLQADDTWQAPYPARWETPDAVTDVVGYYPYSALNDAATELKALPCRVSLDQRSLDSLRASDFLWARAESVSAQDGILSLGFRHRMCKVIFRLQITSDADLVDVSHGSVIFRDVCVAGTVELNTGKVSCDENSRTDVKAYYDSTRKRAEVLLLPQVIPSGSTVALFFGDDTHFRGVEYVFNDAVTLTSGKEYIIDFTHHF